MRNHRFFTVLLALCFVANYCPAQESLLIGAGDLIQVDVIDTPELQQQVRVTDAGNVALAYIGEVHVAGLTPTAAANQVCALLIQNHVMRQPQVTIHVEEYATQNVSIIGEVHSPGNYPLSTPQTILKVLTLAGGLSDDADRHITVKRAGASKEQTYYVSNDAAQAVTDMITVEPGDTVIIPKAPRVYIMGDVNRPGTYAIATNDSRLTMLQAITAAGSVNKTSVKSHVRLIRATPQGPTEMPIHLDAIEKGKEPDIALQPNDVVYVPFSWLRNAAIGSAAILASAAGGAVYLAR